MYTANLNVPLTWSLFAKLPHSGPRVTQLHRFQSCKTSLPPSSAGAGPLWQDSKLLITIAQSWVTWYLSEMPGKLCFPFYTNIIMSFPQTLLAYQLLGGGGYRGCGSGSGYRVCAVLCKCEDMRLEPQKPPDTVAHTCDPRAHTARWETDRRTTHSCMHMCEHTHIHTPGKRKRNQRELSLWPLI